MEMEGRLPHEKDNSTENCCFLEEETGSFFERKRTVFQDDGMESLKIRREEGTWQLELLKGVQFHRT